MNELLSAIVVWLSANFALVPNDELPDLQRLPAAQLPQAMEQGPLMLDEQEVIAFYDDATRTIFLSETWDARSPSDLSVLVHEVVHHLQNVNGLRYPCPASREKIAYAAQDAWLILFDRNLMDEFDLDPFTLKLTTECVPY
ncbi:MAG TPA: DUF6647 family protein [Kiloniellaceae bacterium]|nr:DUF6647 family protein [Kiloniellaceae bacterium]